MTIEAPSPGLDEFLVAIGETWRRRREIVQDPAANLDFDRGRGRAHRTTSRMCRR